MSEWYQQNLHQYRKNVYSQGGEDGVLEFILASLQIPTGFYVDLGASPDGSLYSNTRKLREAGWEGAGFDGKAPKEGLVHQEWLTVANLNYLMDTYKIPREVTLLSLDLDGNDWWLWQTLQVKATIAVVEINPAFPVHISRTIVYNPEHHFDGTIYYGATIAAFLKLAFYKGMKLVYHNRLNAIFVDQKFFPPEYNGAKLLDNFQPHFGHALDTLNRPWVEV